MDKLLLRIQDTVMKYADIISRISNIDVEVVDSRLFRVAGTGMFRSAINQDMSQEGYVYRQVLETGTTMIITEPGQAEICRECPHRRDCRETIEISMPIRMENEIIGVIGLVGTTPEQKTQMLENEELYMDFFSAVFTITP